MARYQLGKQDEARVTLGRLREYMKQAGWSGEVEAEGFLREAEELIEGRPAGKKK
jgi:hypothetical protein